MYDASSRKSHLKFRADAAHEGFILPSLTQLIACPLVVDKSIEFVAAEAHDKYEDDDAFDRQLPGILRALLALIMRLGEDTMVLAYGTERTYEA